MNKKDTKKEAFYFCHVCGEFFNVKGIGHCPECDHHYPVGYECSNCHHQIIKKTMTKAKNQIEF